MLTSSVRMGTTDVDKFFKSQVGGGSRPHDFVGGDMIGFFISSCMAHRSSSRTQPSGTAGVADRSETVPPPTDAWIFWIFCKKKILNSTANWTGVTVW